MNVHLLYLNNIEMHNCMGVELLIIAWALYIKEGVEYTSHYSKKKIYYRVDKKTTSL